MSATVYEARVDHAKIDTAGRWNSGFIIVGVVLGALIAAGLVAAILSDMGWFTIAVAALGLAACTVSTVLAFRRRRALMLLVTGSDTALALTDAEVRLAGAPAVPWSEIVFVGVLDDRQRSARLQRLPLSGPLARASIKAGNGTLLCEIGVRDGAALKAAFQGDAGASRVTLFDAFEGPRRGLVPLMLDAVLDDATAHEAARALIREASARGIPAAEFEAVMAYFDWKGPMIDRKWPVDERKHDRGSL